MSDNVTVWIATDERGKPHAWTVSTTRKKSMDLATEGFMPADEYYRLGTVSRRWAYCYRRGCRVVHATLKLESDPTP